MRPMQRQRDLAGLKILPVHRQIRHRRVVRLSVRNPLGERHSPAPVQVSQCPRRLCAHRNRACHRNLLLLPGNLQQICDARIGKLHRRIYARALVPHVGRGAFARKLPARLHVPRNIQHGSPARDRRTGNQQSAIIGELRIRHHRVDQRVQFRAQLHFKRCALHVALPIQIGRPSRHRTVEHHRAVQHHRHRCGSLLAIRLEVERVQQLIELAQIAHRHVRLQIGQRVAQVHSQHATYLG